MRQWLLGLLFVGVVHAAGIGEISEIKGIGEITRKDSDASFLAELASDILDRGIIMTGGGSMLKGIDQIIRERTNVPVNCAEDPLLSVVKGTGMVLDNIRKYEPVLI